MKNVIFHQKLLQKNTKITSSYYAYQAQAKTIKYINYFTYSILES